MGLMNAHSEQGSCEKHTASKAAANVLGEKRKGCVDWISVKNDKIFPRSTVSWAATEIWS